MTVKVLNNSQALHALCSEDQLDLLNVVDTLRSQGVGHYGVSLPQIIVCGDQSSGKSSVLEAISGVAFPTKSEICTRFPTELVLRKSLQVEISVSIVPDQSRSEAERESLLNFNHSLDGSEEMSVLIERAKSAMGILPHGKAFSKDILRIEVSGPDRPQLTIVDLPGLVHSATKQQSASDVAVVQSLVEDYMKERRSIILAVISAKYDHANQVVLGMTRTADETGERSLGVITKPDKLKPGSTSESTFISLARNQDVYFRRGWHVLKNMDTEEGEASLATRDAEEQTFFSQGIWRTLPRISLGIEHLRQRLSKVLLAQIVTELPSLIEEIEVKVDQCRHRLEQFGQARTTLNEQKAYLLQISQNFQGLVRAAVDGTYNDIFFDDAHSEMGYHKRLRAIAQNLNIEFAAKIRRDGHYWQVVRREPRAESALKIPKLITRKTYIDDIAKLMARTRGRELPGTFNPMIVKDLFSEQCQPWTDIVNNHVQSVWNVTNRFLGLAVAGTADEVTGKAILREILDPAMDEILTQLKSKTDELLIWHRQGHPVTYNHYFTETLQSVRNQRRRNEFTRALKGHFGLDSSESVVDEASNVNVEDLVDALVLETEPDMDRFAASEALDFTDAYYKVAMKRFVDDIAVEVVETALISKLDGIFTPINILNLDDKKVETIAGESEESKQQREDLKRQLEILASGSKTCKWYSAARAQGSTNEKAEDVIASPSIDESTQSDDTGDEEQKDESGIPSPEEELDDNVSHVSEQRNPIPSLAEPDRTSTPIEEPTAKVKKPVFTDELDFEWGGSATTLRKSKPFSAEVEKSAPADDLDFGGWSTSRKSKPFPAPDLAPVEEALVEVEEPAPAPKTDWGGWGLSSTTKDKAAKKKGKKKSAVAVPEA